MTHTAEPWRIYDTGIYPGIDGESGTVVIFGEEGEDAGIRGHTAEERRANAARIVACVNACAGIPDPAQLRADRDALLEALGKVDDCITDLASEARLPIMDFAAANPELGDLLLEIRPLISRIRGEGE